MLGGAWSRPGLVRSATSATGEDLRAMENRITWTLKKHGSGWLTIHEHSSTPASFKTLNVKLKRD
jgi:ketosteroid isomerase-like protein